LSSIKEKAVKIYAKYVVWRTKKWSLNPVKTQKKVFKNLLKKGKKTVFGQEHSFHNITNHSDFSSLVPIRDYEKIKEYIDQIVDGKKMSYGPVNQYILPKHQEPHRVKNTYQSQKNPCHFILKALLMQQCTTLMKLQKQSF
jgi:hypothetical protein